MSLSTLEEYLRENPYTAGAAALTAAAAATLGYIAMSPQSQPQDHPISLNNQSREVAPCVRTSYQVEDGKEENLTLYPFEDAKTCYQAFTRGLRQSNNGPCLGYRGGANRSYKWLSYQEVLDQAQRLGSAFIAKGFKKGDFVLIYSNNCVGWVLTDLACISYSMVSVPLYDTLGKEAVTYVLNQTEAKAVVVGDIPKAKGLLTNPENLKFLKHIIMTESPNQELRELADKANIELHTIQETLEFGSNNLIDPQPGEPKDLHTICYTSGTTGNPKGVMLTHENFMSNLGGILASARTGSYGVELGPSDVHISYLPLAHMFERLAQMMVYTTGGQVGFFGGDVRKLTEDMAVLKPTLFMTVPRLMNRIYDKVISGAQKSAIKSWIFNLAVSKKTALLKRGIMTRDTFWDKLVFRKVQDMFGGNLRFIVSGSAPLAAHVLEFFRIAFGCTVIEGYGQSEVCAGATLQLPYENSAGHVGPPMSCNLVKLIDVPEMDYYIKDNRGEVCIKGPSNMLGYYKQPEKTKEAIDEDGWVHTGDVGEWLPNGTLKIIDRRKNIFKLAQGEYLAPERIEGFYNRSVLVGQVFVDGRGTESFPIAIVVPDHEVIPDWAAKNGVPGDFNTLCKSPVLKDAILKDIHKCGKEAGLKGFEQVRDIYLYPEMFSVEKGFMTPTFKIKRPQLRQFFSDQIDEMYKNANKASS